MLMNVLLVEDDEFKRKKISEFIETEPWVRTISFAASVSGAIQIIDSYSANIVLLDMAVPNYDEGADGAQGLGGVTIFRYLSMASPNTPVMVITQFEELKEGSTVVDIHTLKTMLLAEFGNQFLGLVRYRSSANEWKEEIRHLVNKYIGGVA